MMTDPFGASPDQQFTRRIEGTYGTFSTPAGNMSYLMSVARIGGSGTPWELEFTASLRPVREVLPIDDMDFDELMQRDLDDDRVAAELIPYLLKPSLSGRPLFPPLLALIFPFADGAIGEYPSSAQDFDDGEGMWMRRQTFGDVFRVSQLWDKERDELHARRFGRIEWTSHLAKVVVLDGQHRAMALLAIQRTLSANGWDDSKSARYRHFYEETVRKLVPSGELEGTIEVPVSVCWIPDPNEGGESPQLVARKLFVDVNREAKPPSDDRVVLLSDDNLLNIFTRAVLNDLKGSDTDPPLYAVEYDNSRLASGPTGRWSTITSLGAIQAMVQPLIFGPKRMLANVAGVQRGPHTQEQRDLFMRLQLRVKEILPQRIEEGSTTFSREDLGQLRFPRGAVEPLVGEFSETWGKAIRELLGGLEPYRAHYEALAQLRADWDPLEPSAAEALAKEAVFESGGLYRMLQESIRRHNRLSQSPPDEIKDAWAVLAAKAESFRRQRAEHYLGSANKADIGLCDDMMMAMSTYAVQAALALVVGTICLEQNAPEKAAAVAGAVVESVNRAFSTSPVSGADRKLFLAQSTTRPLNTFRDMNTRRASEFRYLWLEMLIAGCATEPDAALGVSLERLAELRDLARSRYLDYLIREETNLIVKTQRKDRPIAERLATRVVMSQVETALGHWFDVSEGEFGEWATNAELAPDGDDGDDDEADDESEL